jgi:hypothetical protein
MNIRKVGVWVGLAISTILALVIALHATTVVEGIVAFFGFFFIFLMTCVAIAFMVWAGREFYNGDF